MSTIQEKPGSSPYQSPQKVQLNRPTMIHSTSGTMALGSPAATQPKDYNQQVVLGAVIATPSQKKNKRLSMYTKQTMVQDFKDSYGQNYSTAHLTNLANHPPSRQAAREQQIHASSSSPIVAYIKHRSVAINKADKLKELEASAAAQAASTASYQTQALQNKRESISHLGPPEQTHSVLHQQQTYKRAPEWNNNTKANERSLFEVPKKMLSQKDVYFLNVQRNRRAQSEVDPVLSKNAEGNQTPSQLKQASIVEAVSHASITTIQQIYGQKFAPKNDFLNQVGLNTHNYNTPQGKTPIKIILTDKHTQSVVEPSGKNYNQIGPNPTKLATSQSIVMGVQHLDSLKVKQSLKKKLPPSRQSSAERKFPALSSQRGEQTVDGDEAGSFTGTIIKLPKISESMQQTSEQSLNKDLAVSQGSNVPKLASQTQAQKHLHKLIVNSVSKQQDFKNTDRIEAVKSLDNNFSPSPQGLASDLKAKKHQRRQERRAVNSTEIIAASQSVVEATALNQNDSKQKQQTQLPPQNQNHSRQVQTRVHMNTESKVINSSNLVPTISLKVKTPFKPIVTNIGKRTSAEPVKPIYRSSSKNQSQFGTISSKQTQQRSIDGGISQENKKIVLESAETYQQLNQQTTTESEYQKQNRNKSSTSRSSKSCSKTSNKPTQLNSEQMKANLIYSDKQTALQSISPSAGPQVNRKKKMNNRFPSSSRVNNDYFVVTGQVKYQPACPGESGEGLPQIVSPSANNSNSFSAQQDIHGGLFGPERKSQQTSSNENHPNYKHENGVKLPERGSIAIKNQPILFESQECSIVADSAVAVVGSGRKTTHRKSQNPSGVPVDYIAEIEKTLDSPSPRSGAAFRGPKKSIKGSMKQGSPGVMERRNNVSPVHQSGPGANQKLQQNEILSLSPRNLKDIYTQVASNKGKTMKRQSTNRESGRRALQIDQNHDNIAVAEFSHHQKGGPFKDYTLSKGTTQENVIFNSFQPIVPHTKSRGKEHRERNSLQHDLQDPSRPHNIYKSTRSQAKRVMVNQVHMTSSHNSQINGNMQYQIQGKTGTSHAKSGQKNPGSHTAGNRSKMITPLPAEVVQRRPGGGAIISGGATTTSVDNKAATIQVTSEIGGPSSHYLAENHQTQKMPSTTKMNTGALAAHASGSVKNPSIIPAPPKDKVFRSSTVDAHASGTNQTYIPPVQLGKINQLKGPPVNLSHNVTRVKRRIDTTSDAGKGKFAPLSQNQRNLSQINTSTYDEKDGSGNVRSNAVIMEKLNIRSHSKPTMGEKTTEADSYQGGCPSPIDEEQQQESSQNLHRQALKNIRTAENMQHQAFRSANRRNSSNGATVQRKSVASKQRTQIVGHANKTINQGSELASPHNAIRTNMTGPGSKLEPIKTKESVNLKNISIEKRLKNSETCPDQLSPTLPDNQERLVAKVATNEAKGPAIASNGQPPSTKGRMHRNISSKVAKETLETVQQRDPHARKNQQTSSGLRKQVSRDHSFTGLTPVSRQQTLRDSAAQKVRTAEMQAKHQITSLRNFRNLIDTRRQQFPEKQPLELNEFQINLQVGQGAFAIVRRATHKQTKHIIAIKTYDKKNLQDRETQQAVHREINTLSDLWHPCIMKLHEVVDQRTHVHLIMELCQGMSIYHHIKKMPDQRLPEDTCKHIFKQLLRGIAYMHSKNYAHRDLKLDNILMDVATKNIKIIDFGFSLKSKADEKLNVFCGTPHYMDPDLARKQSYNGQAADVWAAGVILYIIFVGKLPFFGEFEADLFRKIQSGKFTTVPNDVGDEKVRNLFRKIFDVNPNTRLTAQQCLDHPWLKDAPVNQEQERQLRQEQEQQAAVPSNEREETTGDNADKSNNI